MRYNKQIIKKDNYGSRFQSSKIIPRIPISSNDRYIEVTVTDRLDLIAHKYYGNRNFWWVIAEANNIGKGTLAIQKGAILRLPADPTAIAMKNGR